MTKQEFDDWADHPITKEILRVFLERIYLFKDELAMNAGNDSLRDKYISGYIAGLNEFINTELDFSEESE